MRRPPTAVLLCLLALVAIRVPASGPPASRLRVTIAGLTVHNRNYREASLLYELQTLLWSRGAGAPSVLDRGLAVRDGLGTALDLRPLDAGSADFLRLIAARAAPGEEISLDEVDQYLAPRYEALTSAYPSLDALRRVHPYKDNPDWLVVPVDSATFQRRRVLHLAKDRIADALTAYAAHGERVIFPEGTVIVAESLDRAGAFVEAEVLRKRSDGFWNFAVYDAEGKPAPRTVAFDEDGVPRPGLGFRVPADCAMCHRLDRLDSSGDPEPPVRSPVRGFFHRLPAYVPQIALGPEYHDHMAFTELTEATHRAKDGVFGPYGSLLLSELAVRKRLGTLSEGDRARYLRLRPYHPELLSPLERTDAVVNSLGMRLLRIPAAGPGARLGSPASDPEHRADESRHTAVVPRDFFMAQHEVTNAQFRRFRPGHRSPAFRGVDLDGEEQPAVGVDYESALAFTAWLGALPAEREAGRTYRLPTEDEWEYVAKGGDDRRFPWGNQWPPPPGSANLGGEETGRVFTTDWPFLHGYEDGQVGTAPVGRFHPNPYLLYDLAGNAYEWTSSAYEAYPGTGGRAPSPDRPFGRGMRVLRGSSWGDELPKVLRCAFRNPVDANTRWPFVGLRVVADIP
jgi:formylglycine-generating enzyme required for sulfatase activity